MGNTKGLKKIEIYYKNIDFCKWKITNDLYEYFLEKSPTVYNRISFQDLRMKDFTGLCLFGKYYIVNFGKIGDTKYRFDIRDFDKNKYGNIIFTLKEYKSNIPYLELSGLFFKTNDIQEEESIEKLPYLLRFEYLQDFLSYFKIDTSEKNVLKNIQFCMDIKGKEAFQIMKFLQKGKDYKGVPVEDLTAFDFRKLQEKKGTIEYGKVKTGLTIPGTYNKLIIYDKILDILQNYLGRLIDGKNPYQAYIDSDEPITRIELEKKASAFQHIADNSTEWIFENIEPLFFDYLVRYFLVDFRKISLVKVDSLNGKKNFFAKRQKEMRLLHSMNMFNAYAKNLKIMLGQGGFEKYCMEKFPELEGKTGKDYLDEFEWYEFINSAE